MRREEVDNRHSPVHHSSFEEEVVAAYFVFKYGACSAHIIADGPVWLTCVLRCAALPLARAHFGPESLIVCCIEFPDQRLVAPSSISSTLRSGRKPRSNLALEESSAHIAGGYESGLPGYRCRSSRDKVICRSRARLLLMISEAAAAATQLL